MSPMSYNSEQNSGRDHAALATRFSIPTVINGRVYIGTRNELDVYGLLPASQYEFSAHLAS
jgi:hypothetical protein